MRFTEDTYPFQASLRWQGDRNRVLSEDEEMALYERNWNYIGVLAEPTQEELQHILKMAKRRRSWLVNECLKRLVDGAAETP
ncbi:hypothetical protein [Thalassospira sp.]|uniref:hypothetical protein n=1 Tax=Thalassospira sp. TaxID=1912094 RepID=UPI001B0CEA2E|nr:hypothetical protein [Thalassospira sp.]MBO6807544.1 hypothetical protein [Thalassospira sp.]MBO6840069.1 hypothetical protein [Thalassospira sp.]